MQLFEAEDLKYTYSPEHTPIGTVQPGELFTIDTSDCFTGRYSDPANFTPEVAAWVESNLNPVTGPLAVAGAVAGGAVEITIESIMVTTPASVVVSRCQAVSPHDWWHEEDHVRPLGIRDGRIELRPEWSIPISPLIGCLATAPQVETVLSRHEGAYGGNMDCPDITSGAVVTLPVEVDGGLVYFGDCKAAMGMGEITCSAEVGTRLTARVTPVPRPPSMRCPRVRTGTQLTTIVSDISLADAARHAFAQLKLWLQDDYGLTSADAAVLLGLTGHCRICQVSNQLHTASATIDLAVLPN